MRLSEPSTTLTDYLIAAAALAMAWRLAGAATAGGQVAPWLWAAAFLATAIAAALGGTVHGFGPSLGPATFGRMWQGSLQSIALAGALFAAGTIVAALADPLRAILLLAVGLQWAAFAWWLRRRDAFRYVLYDYGGLMVLVLALSLWRLVDGGDAAAAWIAGGVAVSFVAAGVQRGGRGLHRHLNHNDLYHLLQLAGLWLLYRGGLLLVDR